MSYEASKAARLISWSNERSGAERLSEKQLRDWVDAGVASLEWDDIWEGEKYIDFRAMISLRLISQLYARGVSVGAINESGLWLRRELGVEWPFASKALWSFSDLSALEGETISYFLKKLFLCSLNNSPLDLEFDSEGVACIWRPFKDVVIHPGVVSGSPCVIGTRTPTCIFPGMLKRGDSVEDLAAGYRLTKERVLNALEWERQLAAVNV